MKKILSIWLSITLSLSLVACNDNKSAIELPHMDNNSSKKISYSGKTLDGILEGITADFNSTIDYLYQKLDSVYGKTTDTYDLYLENKNLLLDWYDLVQKETSSLFERTELNSANYYKLIISSIDNDDADAIEDAMDNYYDSICDDAYDGYYDRVLDDLFDDIYDKYYDGVIDDAYDTIPYKEWSDEISNFYDAWSQTQSDVYKQWSRSQSSIYKKWSRVSEKFWDEDFNIDNILKLNESSETQTSDRTNSYKMTNTANNQSYNSQAQTHQSLSTLSNSKKSENWKQFLKDYEEWADSYIEFMKKYKTNPSSVSLISEYGTFLAETAKWAERAEEYEEELEEDDDLPPGVLTEYFNTIARIMQKISDI